MRPQQRQRPLKLQSRLEDMAAGDEKGHAEFARATGLMPAGRTLAQRQRDEGAAGSTRKMDAGAARRYRWKPYYLRN